MRTSNHAAPGTAHPALLLLGLLLPVALVGGVFAIAFQGRDPGDALLHTVRVEVPADGGWPRTAVAVSGERNVLRAPAHRIVVGNTTGVDMVAALAPPDAVAALCDQAFTWSLLARPDDHPDVASAWKDVPTFTELTAENVLRYRPDLILVSAYNDPGTIAALTAAGSPVVCLPYPTTLDGVLDNLDLLARALGTEDRAAELRPALEERLRAAGADAPTPRPRALYYSNYGNGGSTFGRSTLGHAALEAAGFENAAADRVGFADLSYEELLVASPDLIVVGEDHETGVATAREILRRSPVADALPAVRNDRFVVLHASLYSTTSQEIVDVVERLAAARRRLPATAPDGTGDGR